MTAQFNRPTADVLGRLFDARREGVLFVLATTPTFIQAAYARHCHDEGKAHVVVSPDPANPWLVNVMVNTYSMRPPMTQAQLKGLEVALRDVDIVDLSNDYEPLSGSGLVWGFTVPKEYAKTLLPSVLEVLGLLPGETQA